VARQRPWTASPAARAAPNERNGCRLPADWLLTQASTTGCRRNQVVAKRASEHLEELASNFIALVCVRFVYTPVARRGAAEVVLVVRPVEGPAG
jgi:hypothetical protein